MSSDLTESIRREMVVEINAVKGSREYLEAEHGEVYDRTELQELFEVTGFMAPFLGVRRKSDGAKGSMKFQNSPRFYFGFQKE